MEDGKEKKRRKKVEFKKLKQLFDRISALKGKISLQKIFSFTVKLIMLCVIPMVIISFVITFISTKTVSGIMLDETEGALYLVAESVSQTYTNLYEGDYSQDKGGVVRKGDTKISKNTDLIDGLKESTDYDVSMDYGQMRLVTTFKKESGKRINGTKIDDDIYEKVQAGEPVFITDYTLNEGLYDIYYYPLVNSDGSVIGSIEVGRVAASQSGVVASQVKRIVVFTIILLALALVLIILITLNMSKAMKKSKDFLSGIVDGDLKAEPDVKLVKRKDEFGDIYRTSVKLQETLRNIVVDIKNSSDNLTNSANVLNAVAGSTGESVNGVLANVEEINNGADAQSSQSVEASENVLLINKEIEDVGAAVNAMAGYAQSMAEAEKASSAIIGELHVSSETTTASLEKALDEIGRLEDSVNAINEAVTLIQNIAEETDLLSLNASIEAARAGDAGRGFAVVAEQISKLASESSVSASKINDMIENVVNVATRASGFMEQVGVDMKSQQKKLDETETQYKAVADAVELSLESISDIKEKMSSLATSSDKIQGIVNELGTVSQSNVSSAVNTMEEARSMSDTVEELQNASKDLLTLSDRLGEMLVVFKM